MSGYYWRRLAGEYDARKQEKPQAPQPQATPSIASKKSAPKSKAKKKS